MATNPASENKTTNLFSEDTEEYLDDAAKYLRLIWRANDLQEKAAKARADAAELERRYPYLKGVLSQVKTEAKKRSRVPSPEPEEPKKAGKKPEKRPSPQAEDSGSMQKKRVRREGKVEPILHYHTSEDGTQEPCRENPCSRMQL